MKKINRQSVGDNPGEEYESNVSNWEKENQQLRAGRSSSYNKYRRYAQDTPYQFRRGNSYRPTNGNKRLSEISRKFNDSLGFHNNNKRRSSKDVHSVHFEKFADEGHRFIGEVARELGTDDHRRALRITRAILHAVRDRINPDDAVQFAQGLPLIIKGIYFEEYDISKTPITIKRPGAFLDFIRMKNRFAAVHDFPDPDSVVDALQAVFRVLERNLDVRQVRKIKPLLGREILDLIDEGYENYQTDSGYDPAYTFWSDY